MSYCCVYIKKTSSHTTKMLGKVVFPVGPVVYVGGAEDHVEFKGNFD